MRFVFLLISSVYVMLHSPVFLLSHSVLPAMFFWLSVMVPNYQVNEDLILKLATISHLLLYYGKGWLKNGGDSSGTILVDNYIIQVFFNEGTSVSILSIDLK